MIFRVLPALLLAVSLMPSGLLAAEVKGLYEAEMLVPDQSRSERGLAMSAALAEVVAKVSGQRDARLQPKVSRAIARPARLLQQYRYRPLPADVSADAMPGDDPQQIFFRFDKQAVNRLLRDSGLPVWGATRPSLLAWVAVEDGGRRYLLGADDAEELRSLVEEEAKRRGLPLVLPLQDLQDQQRVQFADVWGRFREPVLQASRRYHPEAVLMGRLTRLPDDSWRADWWIAEGTDSENWQVEGVLPVEVVAEGMATALDWLAGRYAGQALAGEAGQLLVTVRDVEGLADFARVEQYLQSLQQVEQVSARQIDAGRVDYVLTLEGSPEGIAQTIALGRLLIAEVAEGAALAEVEADALTTLDPFSAPATVRQQYRLRH